MRFGGVGGVWTDTIAEHLNDNGLDASYSLFSWKEILDDAIKKNGAVIVEYLWIGKNNMAMHYITLEHRPDLDPAQPYIAYNEFNDSTDFISYPSFDAHIRESGYIAISYVTVNERR